MWKKIEKSFYWNKILKEKIKTKNDWKNIKNKKNEKRLEKWGKIRRMKTDWKNEKKII